MKQLLRNAVFALALLAPAMMLVAQSDNANVSGVISDSVRICGAKSEDHFEEPGNRPGS